LIYKWNIFIIILDLLKIFNIEKNKYERIIDRILWTIISLIIMMETAVMGTEMAAEITEGIPKGRVLL